MKQQSVLVVNGSPHRKGSTNRALEEVIRVLEEEGVETEAFWVGAKPLAGCIACMKCAETGRCAFDDRVNEFLDSADRFDGFVFGSPVHWGAATGTMTSFMDRAFYAAEQGRPGIFRLKPAAAVISARRAGTTATYDQMNKYFGLMQMPIISSRYWNIVHGGRNAPEDVEQDLEGLLTMRVLARNMAFFLACKQTALEASVPLPADEPPVFTNFIR